MKKGGVINGPIKCYEGENITVQSILNSGLAASPCNKLFKAEVIKRYPFLVGKMNEDVASVIPAIVSTEGKIAYVENEKYYYVQRRNSAQNSEFSDRRFDMFDAISLCFERIREFKDFEKNSEIILYHQVLMLFTCVIIEIKDKKKRKEIIEKFIKKQKAYKVQKNPMLNGYIKNQDKDLRLYYKMVTKSLNLSSASITNLIISCKKMFMSKKQKK